MENFKTIWNQKKSHEKALSVLGILCSTAILILAIVQLLDIGIATKNILQALVGVLMVIQTAQNWNKNKKLAIFSLCIAIFIFSLIFLILITK